MHNKIALIGLVIVLMAGIVLAKAMKVELIPYSYTDPDGFIVAPLEPDASGHTILNYAKGDDKTVIQVTCRNVTANTEYTVYLKNGGWHSIGFLPQMVKATVSFKLNWLTMFQDIY